MCGADLSDLDKPVPEGIRSSYPTKPARKRDPDEDRQSDAIK